MINEFIKIFTTEDLGEIKRIGRRYYLVSKEEQEVKETIKISPEHIGIYLGEEKKDHFRASLSLIDMLSKLSDRKIFIDDKAEWLFLCGRDIMAGSIKKVNVISGLVLIQNEKDENLGLGKVIARLDGRKMSVCIKNVIDKGDFLRREMDH